MYELHMRARCAITTDLLFQVWGGVATLTTTTRNFRQLQQLESLMHHTTLPATVSDAMVITREMGVRYLWADCLSIIQDSFTKHEDIKHMDIIYSQAELTIVAVNGENASSGLPGVRQGTRHQKHISHHDNPPWRYRLLSDTTYNSRGW